MGRALARAAGLGAAALAAGCSSTLGQVPGGSRREGPAAVATAARINLAPSDLPAGWRGRRQPSSSPGTGPAAALAACLHTSRSGPGQDADVSSASYSQGPYRAGSEVVLSASSARAEAGFDALVGPRGPHCIATVLGRVVAGDLPAGAAIAGTRVGRLATAAPSGVRAAGYWITMTVTAMGHQLSVYSDISLLDRGRVSVTVSAVGIDARFPPTLRSRIDRRVGGRLAASAAA